MKAAAILALALLVCACGSFSPQPINAGDICETCKKQITDVKFAGEAITKQGVVLKFRTPECLAAYTRANSDIQVKFVTDYTTNRMIRSVLGDWVFGGILTYRSGSMIGVPSSRTSNIGNYTGQNNTRMNRVNDQWMFKLDPSCHCIDPNRDTELLNRAMWQDVGQGQWGFSAPTYSDYRWVRQANEQMSLGRQFFFNEARRLKLTVRRERGSICRPLSFRRPAA